MHQSFMWFLWLNWRKSTFIPSLLRKIQNVDLLWRHRYYRQQVWRHNDRLFRRGCYGRFLSTTLWWTVHVFGTELIRSLAIWLAESRDYHLYIIQIKICAEYRDMLPRPRLVCQEPGLRPICRSPGGRLNKKDGLTRYGNSHVKDKTS